MTNISRISCPGSPLDLATPLPSAFSLCFAGLLSALDQHIECERDLDDVDLFDPAYQNWLDDAETAQLRLYDLASITGLAAVTPDDVPLRRMTLLIAMLVREGSAEAFRQYGRLESSFLRHMVVPGDGLGAVRTRLMLADAREKIRAMAELTLYRQDGDIDGEACELCAAA
ncbi:hypothetical protein KTN05_17060 [Paracoccus sp. Z118]|uniref:hypothetical protein n=1 Tax=Paracoccus sp. Z118 TaxID=2851017 RepID=UPI001C2BF28A|nr:hypothetical protein [Paracoccus sp. Z118]MBV0893500.1 hypothetical protein [Paracoccus sp. Z118]